MRQMGTLQNPRGEGEGVPSLRGQGREGGAEHAGRLHPRPTLRTQRKSSHHPTPHAHHPTPSSPSVSPSDAHHAWVKEEAARRVREP